MKPTDWRQNDTLLSFWQSQTYPGLKGPVKDMILSLVSSNLVRIQMSALRNRPKGCKSGLSECEEGWKEYKYDNHNATVCVRNIGASRFSDDLCSKSGAKRLYAQEGKPYILWAFKEHLEGKIVIISHTATAKNEMPQKVSRIS